jgi:hypothetical protein
MSAASRAAGTRAARTPGARLRHAGSTTSRAKTLRAGRGRAGQPAHHAGPRRAGPEPRQGRGYAVPSWPHRAAASRRREQPRAAPGHRMLRRGRRPRVGRPRAAPRAPRQRAGRAAPGGGHEGGRAAPSTHHDKWTNTMVVRKEKMGVVPRRWMTKSTEAPGAHGPRRQQCRERDVSGIWGTGRVLGHEAPTSRRGGWGGSRLADGP